MKKIVNQTEFARTLRKNQTDAESLLWSMLRNRQLAGIKFRRQHPIGKYIADFVSVEKKLVIELDGGQHNAPLAKRYDESRAKYLTQQGYRVLRFWDNDVLTQTDLVLEQVLNLLTSP